MNKFEHVINYNDLMIDAIWTRRKIDAANICKYWISILDKYLGWILNNELVVVWADTWCW